MFDAKEDVIDVSVSIWLMNADRIFYCPWLELSKQGGRSEFSVYYL